MKSYFYTIHTLLAYFATICCSFKWDECATSPIKCCKPELLSEYVAHKGFFGCTVFPCYIMLDPTVGASLAVAYLCRRSRGVNLHTNCPRVYCRKQFGKEGRQDRWMGGEGSETKPHTEPPGCGFCPLTCWTNL